MRVHRGPVLPRIAVERIAEGALLRVKRPGGKEIAILALLIVALGMFVFAAIVGSARISNMLNAAGGLTMILGMAGDFLRRRRLFRATLVVHPWPIRLCDEVSM